jgi:hypothetical protein
MASIGFTQTVVDKVALTVQPSEVLNREQLLARLREKVATGEVRNVDIARALDLPDSRIPALLRGERRLFYDEAVRLVEAFALQPVLPPVPDAVWRLVGRHIASRLGLPVEVDDPQMVELLADLQAFSRFVSDPQVRESIEAAQTFFRAMQLRPRVAPTDQSENDPQRVS